jgi:hypothetical protein
MLFGSSGVRRKYGCDLCDLALAIGPSLISMGGRILLGTEPKIRLTAEGMKPAYAKEMLRTGGDIIRTWKSA